jgi:hypothetical protein
MKAIRALPRAFYVALMGCLSPAIAQASAPVKIQFERLNVSLALRVRENEFIVVRTDADLRKMWEQHARPKVPGTTVPRPPKVDFSRFFVIAFFGGHSACEPYRIADVLEYGDNITVHVSHRLQGDNCTCITIFAPSINVVIIKRTDKPLDHIINSERVDCGGSPIRTPKGSE